MDVCVCMPALRRLTPLWSLARTLLSKPPPCAGREHGRSRKDHLAVPLPTTRQTAATHSWLFIITTLCAIDGIDHPQPLGTAAQRVPSTPHQDLSTPRVGAHSARTAHPGLAPSPPHTSRRAPPWPLCRRPGHGSFRCWGCGWGPGPWTSDGRGEQGARAAAGLRMHTPWRGCRSAVLEAAACVAMPVEKHEMWQPSSGAAPPRR